GGGGARGTWRGGGGGGGGAGGGGGGAGGAAAPAPAPPPAGGWAGGAPPPYRVRRRRRAPRRRPLVRLEHHEAPGLRRLSAARVAHAAPVRAVQRRGGGGRAPAPSPARDRAHTGGARLGVANRGDGDLRVARVAADDAAAVEPAAGPRGRPSPAVLRSLTGSDGAGDERRLAADGPGCDVEREAREPSRPARQDEELLGAGVHEGIGDQIVPIDPQTHDLRRPQVVRIARDGLEAVGSEVAPHLACREAVLGESEPQVGAATLS